MAVLGVCARVQSSKFAVGFAVLDGGAIISSSHLCAPSSEDAISLSELYRMAHDFIGAYQPEKVALLKYENRQNVAAVATASRAEGAVLAAAGHRDCPVVEWGNVGALRRPVGLKGTAKSPVTYDEVTAMIAGADGVETEVGYAAAAALAALAG
jgi:Holliday junction resolvasome RuvABC endonuclease subunit